MQQASRHGYPAYNKGLLPDNKGPCLAVRRRIDEGLVNTEKPWCGTRQFGMAFYDQRSQVCVL